MYQSSHIWAIDTHSKGHSSTRDILDYVTGIGYGPEVNYMTLL